MAINNKFFLSIDIGGTKIEVCKFDADYSLICSDIIPTVDLQIGSIKFIDGIKKIIEANFNDDVERMGVSFNASVKNGIVIYSSLMGGRVDYPLEEIFSKQFKVPVRLMNDVNAMAMAESRFGTGKNAHSFALVNLGTGIKVSFVHEGFLVEGYAGNAGEISQKKVIFSEFSSEAIKLEDIVSGSGIKNIYYKFSGKEKKAKEIFDIVNENKNAQKTVDIFSRYLAKVFEEVGYFFNPEKIILSGSMKKAEHFFLPQAIDLYRKNVIDILQVKDIVISDLEHSACLGAIIE